MTAVAEGRSPRTAADAQRDDEAVARRLLAIGADHVDRALDEHGTARDDTHAPPACRGRAGSVAGLPGGHRAPPGR